MEASIFLGGAEILCKGALEKKVAAGGVSEACVEEVEAWAGEVEV